MRKKTNNQLTQKPEISVISPVYQGEFLVNRLVEEIIEAVSGEVTSYEIILVEDGSRDKSWEAILRAANKEKEVYGIRLSRNYGQHNAIRAGLEASQGRWVTVIDCDLQDDPKGIPELLKKAKNGFDIVLARRVNRKDGRRKRLGSLLFNAVFNSLLATPLEEGVGNFGIYSRESIDCVLDGEQAVNYFPAMISNAGFKRCSLDIEHRRRVSGRSNYSFKRLVRLSISSIIGFSEKPIRLLAFGGFLISALACIAAAFYFGAYLAGYISIQGYTSMIIVTFLTFGLNTLMLGMIGLYVGKTLELAKMRRPYYISETSRCNAE